MYEILVEVLEKGRLYGPTTQDLLHGSFRAFHLNHRLFTIALAAMVASFFLDGYGRVLGRSLFMAC